MDLTGRVLVNLSSDSPDRLRTASQSVAERGGTLVTGGIMVPPPGIGQPSAYVFYSGPHEVVEAHRETLEALGRADYMGADPGLAMLYYQAMLNMFWTTLVSYFYSAALVGTAGISAEDLRPYAAALLADLTDEGPMGFLKILTAEIERGVYPGAENNLHMQAVGSEHVVHAFEQVGLDTGMPQRPGHPVRPRRRGRTRSLRPHRPDRNGPQTGGLSPLFASDDGQTAPPSSQARRSRPFEMVSSRPIVQHIGHPRSATTPSGRSSRLYSPTAGRSANAPISPPNPITPRTR